MGLPPVGQPPEDNCCACLNAGKAAVMIKVGLGLESVVWVRVSFTVRVSSQVQCYTTGYSILQL